MLRIVNSYYSNKIESEGTHPIDIERASKKDFSTNANEKKLQLLSLAYIQTQKEIEDYFANDDSISPYSKSFILSAHEKLYSKEGMGAFLDIESNGKSLTMVPGAMRSYDVEVGRHIAPEKDLLPTLMNQYESLYGSSLGKHRLSEKLLYALSSHHRLTWIHPFLDGNGRTSRLVLDGVFCHIKLPGYGLWNISRGLARNSNEYKTRLSNADIQRQGDLDGRGPLSNKALIEFNDFMLDCMLDQIRYIGKYLKLNELSSRLDKYVAKSWQNELSTEPLPKYSDIIFRHLLLNGEASRGSIAGVIGVSERTSRAIMSKLADMDYITSDTPKSAIRLKFKAHLASHLFPELIPEK
jgi:Fic family protein